MKFNDDNIIILRENEENINMNIVENPIEKPNLFQIKERKSALTLGNIIKFILHL